MIESHEQQVRPSALCFFPGLGERVSPSRTLSASSPLMSMSDLQTAHASSFQSCPNRLRSDDYAER